MADLDALLLKLPGRGLAPRAARALGAALGRLPPVARVEVLREAIRGVAAAHEGGLAALLRRLVHAVLRDAPVEVVQAVHGELAALVAEDARSIDYAVASSRNVAALLARLGVPIAGARVLELGPGWSLAGGLALLSLGAARWAGVDVAPLATTRSAPYRALRARVAQGLLGAEARLDRFDAAVDLSGDEARFDAARLEYRGGVDGAALPFADGALDVVVSNAVLEHVRDAAAVLRETRRVLAPGGHGVHMVDLRDHRDFDRPRAFLEDDDAAWAARFTGRELDHEFTNRLRKGDLLRLAREAGFEVCAADVTLTRPLDPGERERLAPRFRGLEAEELEALSVLLVLRAP